MVTGNPIPPEPPQEPRPPRRKRYPGKCPRRFDQRYKELHPEAFRGIHAHVRAQGRTPAGAHVPVLMAEVAAALAPATGETVVDCTLGYGGHAVEFLRRIGPAGRLIAFDVDAAEMERTRRRLAEAFPAGSVLPLNSPGGPGSCGESGGPRRKGTPGPGGGPRVILRRGNFAGIDRALGALGINGVDVIFADLGASSMQVDDPSRGFSYKQDGPLDMRMDSRLTLTAADLINRLSEEGLAAALVELADEADHAAIAAAIVRERRRQPLTRTRDLVRVVLEAKGLDPRRWRKAAAADKLHPAALTFQALRMLVNDEPGALRQLLRVAPACLRPGGRIGIISFHSGEDRIVKQAFREGLRQGVYEAASDEVIRPSREEVHANPRAAPAKFRWAVTSAERATRNAE
jgi:16S rRNA (cytosine1402-N4)-methyltransferase